MEHNIENKDTYGVKAEAAYMDDYEVVAKCPETGYTGKIKVSTGLSFYNDYGKLTENTPAEVDGICEVRVSELNKKRCLEIIQYISGPSHSDGIDYLISLLTWQDDSYVILKQECIPF